MRKPLILVVLILSFAQIGLVNAAGFSAFPAFPNKIDPSQFTIEAKPGTTVTESITLNNADNQEMDFYIHGVDSMTNTEGKLTYKTSDKTQTGAGGWIKFNQNPVKVGPNTKEIYQFTIEVPADAKLGSYKAGIEALAMGKAPTELEKGMEVTVNTRFVDKVNITVTNDPKPIEKMPTPPATPRTITPAQLYFYGSLALFIIVIGGFGIKALLKKKKARHAAAQAHHHTEEKHDEHTHHHSEK